MPQSVRIDLPLVISGRGGLTLVRPIGFPDIALAAGNQAAAIRAVRRRVVKQCRAYVGSELVSHLVRAEAHRQTIEVAIAPEKKTTAWRDPIRVRFDAFVWQQAETMVVAYIPPLDLTVVATPQTNLENLVQEQIRSSIRRRGVWSLVGLAKLDQTDDMTLVNQRIELTTPTPAEHARKQQDQPKTKTPTLGSVATRLRRQAMSPAYHREGEVKQLAGLLTADPPRSVLLVGPSGVGKTAIFHDWVRRRGEFGDRTGGAIACWATDGSRLISGQCGFGMWQQQCLAMADEARRYPSVVHLGNLVELSESGRLRGSGGCGALLAPRLAEGSLRAVIECTLEQLTRVQRIEPRLVQAMTVLRVEEPTPEQTRSILLEAASAWRPVDITEQLKRKKRQKAARRSGGKSEDPPSAAVQPPQPPPVVEPEALQVLDRLHRRFRTDAAAPGRPLAFFHTVMSELGCGQTLTAQKVIEAFGRQTGLPGFLIDDAIRPDLDRIQSQLLSQVIGQDAVIETLVDMIATLAADLSRGDRPLASMMLIGPTGVGKTETAKSLARLIYSDVSRLVRIDMSELSTPGAVGRLIGDSMHPEGLLTSAVRAQPFSLVLLDEFEKAHPTVFDLLLQVLGEGRLTDGRGRLADFRNSIVMMTSNLGVDTFHAVPLGLADTQQVQRYHNHFERQLRDFLRPELFNRIDRILTYDPLDPLTVQRIAKLRINELQRRDGWQRHGDQFEIDEAALQSLMHHGYQPQYGARPLTREVERSVVIPLSEAICESGRINRLDANITTENSNDRAAVRVHITSDQQKHKRSEDGITGLITDLTTLRRRGQALDRCDAVRRLRNQYTMVNRKLKTLLRAVSAEDKREKIRYGPLGIDRMQTRQRLLHVRRICADISAAEARLLSRYYRGQTIDSQDISETIASLRQQLWDMLCELHSEAATDNQRMTLVLIGPNFTPTQLLLSAYRRLAVSRKWNLQAHCLIPRSNSSAEDSIGDCPGWSREPAFRVSTDRERVESALDHWIQSEQAQKPSLSAHRMLQADAFSSLPAGAVAVMLTFRGQSAAFMMAGEAGVHTFKRMHQSTSTGCSMLIDKHLGMPIEYVAPEWLPRRQFQLTGHPRRWYDEESKLVQDMTELNSRTIKMDREGRWLENLIEQESERRIWAELDDDLSDSDRAATHVVITN